MHGRSVVMFGPTPVGVFGYPQNINLEPVHCKACWFSTETWLVECPRHTSGPQCMSEHSTGGIIEAVNTILSEAPAASASVIATTPRPGEDRTAALAEVVREASSNGASRNCVFIGDDADKDILDRLPNLNPADFQIIHGWDADVDAGGRRVGDPQLEYGTLLNIPRPDASLDVLVCLCGAWSADVATFHLRECFRVLRPGGVLAVADPNGGVGVTLQPSLVLAGAERAPARVERGSSSSARSRRID